MTTITAKKFKKGFDEGKTWGDANKLIEKLTDKQALEIYRATKITKRWFGVDMRTDFFLSLLKHRLKVED